MHQFERPALDVTGSLHDHAAEGAWDQEIWGVARTDKIHPNTTNWACREEAITEGRIHHPAAMRHKGREKLIKTTRCQMYQDIIRNMYHTRDSQTSTRFSDSQGNMSNLLHWMFTSIFSISILGGVKRLVTRRFHQSCMLGKGVSSWSCWHNLYFSTDSLQGDDDQTH